ncbi:MAG: DUF3667 domain-containing protein [Bacteroidia bacterium]|nr:DUF3667 domain-containing protein [Bacteroidia bacterium]
MKPTYTPAQLFKPRNEKKCLNCDSTVAERFCGVCGQENIQHQDSFWHLIVHFFNDITHYDSKLLSSLKLLITSPGYLTTQFILGKRKRYLEPIKMYVFISFVCFLTIGYLSSLSVQSLKSVKSKWSAPSAEMIKGYAATGMDSLVFDELGASVLHYANPIFFLKKAQTIYFPKGLLLIKETSFSSIFKDDGEHLSFKEKFSGYINCKIFCAVKKHGTNESSTKLVKNVLVNLPKMFFLLLPLFAFILTLLYKKQKKYFIDHAIFSIHFHCFLFIVFIVLSPVVWFFNHWAIYALLLTTPLVYLFFAMRKVYAQSLGKTLVKFALQTSLYGLSLLIVLVVNFMWSLSSI